MDLIGASWHDFLTDSHRTETTGLRQANCGLEECFNWDIKGRLHHKIQQGLCEKGEGSPMTASYGEEAVSIVCALSIDRATI